MVLEIDPKSGSTEGPNLVVLEIPGLVVVEVPSLVIPNLVVQEVPNLEFPSPLILEVPSLGPSYDGPRGPESCGLISTLMVLTPIFGTSRTTRLRTFRTTMLGNAETPG